MGRGREKENGSDAVTCADSFAVHRADVRAEQFAEFCAVTCAEDLQMLVQSFYKLKLRSSQNDTILVL